MNGTLGDFAAIILGGTPKTSNNEFWDGDIPWVTSGDIGDAKHISTTDRSITEAGFRGSNTKLIDIGDVVISARGTVGKIMECDRPMAFNQSCYAIRTMDAEVLHQRYVYYLIHNCVNYLRQNASGAVFNAIVMSTLSRTPVKLPPLDNQKRIASILSAYDDLIENNRRRIQLLEQAARLLYKEWFVHLRFPGHEHVTITDDLPEGWKKRELSEISDITMGQSPKSIYYNDDGNGLPFHQGVTNFSNRFPSHKTYCTIEARLAEPGDILFSVRAPVGRINITPDKIVIGRGLAAVRSNLGQQNFLFYALKNHFFKEDMMGGGAIFAAITKKDLYGVKLLQPPDRLIKMFLEHVQPLDRQIENIHRSINGLIKARDLLLPRLMNREVAV